MKAETDVIALRYFVAVAEHGNYARAASALRVTQPAISRQVRFLERRYGTPLLRPEGRQWARTEAGQHLLQEAREILARIDGLDHALSAAARRPTGRLSLGLAWATWESLLPGILARFRAKHPAVSLHVMQDHPGHLADALIAHRIDIAIVNQLSRREELDALSLTSTRSGLLIPRTSGSIPPGVGSRRSIALSQALRLPLILPPRGHTLRDLIEGHGVRQRVRPHVIVESDSLPFAMSLVAAGHGYTIVTPGSLDKASLQSDFDLVPIRAPSITWPLYAATRKSATRTLAQQAMLDALSAYARDARACGTRASRMTCGRITPAAESERPG